MNPTTELNDAQRPALPKEIIEALRDVRTDSLIEMVKAEKIYSENEIEALRATCGAFLDGIWYNGDVSAYSFRTISGDRERRQAVWSMLERQIFAPIVEGLRKAGLANETVLFRQRGIILTPAMLNSHTTDRIILKSHRAEERRSFFGKPYTKHFFELEASYPERGRWGDYDTVSLECRSDEAAQKFTDALAVARMVGQFNAFLDYSRRFI